MANSSIVIVTRFSTTSKAARDQLLDHLSTTLQHSRVNDPGVLKYAVCLPDTTSPYAPEETSICLVEEYTDSATHAHHKDASAVTSFSGDSSTSTLLDPARTEEYTVSWLPKPLLVRSDRLPVPNLDSTTSSTARVSNPYIIFATITDPDPTHLEALKQYGAAVIKDAEANEPDTILYGDAAPIKLPNTSASNIRGKKAGDGKNESSEVFICAVEAYATKAACEAHLKSASVKDLVVEGHKLGSKFEIAALKMKGGWLVRE